MADWYVDSTASGSNDGTSWADAWESFADISWGSISPGDTLYISGGSTSKIYAEKLTVGASGSDGNPITISIGQDEGHNGTAILMPATDSGLWLGGKSYVTITGNYGGLKHIQITGCDTTGMELYGAMHHIILEYLEIFENGDANNENGITMQADNYNGRILELRYCSLHDNYQDEIFITGPTDQGSMYGRILIHHNLIYNLNDDGLEAICGGIDFYNNVVYGRGSSGAGGHPDGVQIQKGYTRVFNNIFHSFSDANSYIFIDLYNGEDPLDAAHIRVYNNLIYQNVITGDFDPLRGIAFKLESTITSVDDVIIANNTVVNTPAWGMTLTFNNLDAAHMTGIKVLNNVLYNCFTTTGGQIVIFGTGTYTMGSYGDGVSVEFDFNAVHAGPNGTTQVGHQDDSIYSYDDWVALSGCQDDDVVADPDLSPGYRPNKESPLINVGVDLSGEFTEDLDGKTRAAFDLGVYEYVTGGYLRVY